MAVIRPWTQSETAPELYVLEIVAILLEPSEWWGVFWLPAFYATALCVLVLVWSIQRDARTLVCRRGAA